MTRLVKLSELIDINPRMPKPALKETSKSVFFLPMSSVSENGELLSPEERELSEVVKGYTYFKRGDVIVAKITPCFENGKAAYLIDLPHDMGFGSTEFHVLRPNSDVDGQYLYYMIWNPAFRFVGAKNMTGSAGQKRVSVDFLKRFKIPLPPIKEQRRIATILDKANAIRRKREQAIKLADEFLRSVFLDMLGNPVKNPKNIPIKPLGKVAKVERGKFTPRPRNDPKYYNGVYPFIQTGDISSSAGYIRDWKQTLNDDGIKVSRSFKAGTTVIAIVGATAILDIEVYCPDSVIGIIPLKNEMTSEFIEYAMRFWKPIFISQAPETARANINLEKIKPIEFPVPPINKQLLFSSVYKMTYKKLTRHKGHEDDLFNSLTQRAFRGEL